MSLALLLSRRLAASASVARKRCISTSDVLEKSKNVNAKNLERARQQLSQQQTAEASSSTSGNSAASGLDNETPASTSTPPSADSPSTSSSNPAAQATPTFNSLPSLDFSAELNSLPAPSNEGAPEKQTTGARSSKESLSTIERRRRFMSRVGMALVAAGLVSATVYMGREWEAGEDVPQNGSEMSRLERTSARLRGTTDVFDKPAWKELLPPPLAPPHQRPYTLLISLEDLMTASTWDREHGWRTAKRPGIEYFIGYLSQFYEIVVFTSQYAYSAIPVLEQIDPFTLYISYKLFRESTRSVDGKLVKDLSYLNRDLSKVIMIDTNPEHLELQPENGIIIPKWKGDKENRAGLVNLIPFLESIAIHQPQDVRPILKAYAGKDVAVEYAKVEEEQKRKHIERWEASGGKKSVVSGLSMSKVLGGGPTTPTHSASGAPLTYLEQKRLEAQANYRAELAWFKQQEPTFKKMIEEEREKQAKEMSGSLFGMIMGESGPLAVMGGAQEQPQGQKPDEKLDADKGAAK